MIFWEGQQDSSNFSDVGKKILDSPNFFLTSESVFSAQNELSIKTFLFESSGWSAEDLAEFMIVSHPSWLVFVRRVGYAVDRIFFIAASEIFFAEVEKKIPDSKFCRFFHTNALPV